MPNLTKSPDTRCPSADTAGTLGLVASTGSTRPFLSVKWIQAIAVRKNDDKNITFQLCEGSFKVLFGVTMKLETKPLAHMISPSPKRRIEDAAP